MKITKIIENRINIDNISDMYCADYNKNILNILKKLYVNRCFKSIYILDIIRIVSRSGLHCKNKTLDGGTYIDISFEVSGICYEKGEIIHGCKIINISNDGSMIAKSNYASIKIENPDNLVLVEVDDEIPVIVRMSRYNIYEEEVSIMAIPLMPMVKPSIIYKIIDNVDNDTNLFDYKELTKLENTLKDIKKNNKLVYKFFTELLYPYKSIKGLQAIKGTEINMTNLNKLEADDMLYTPESYLDDNTFILVNKNKEILKKNDTTTLEISKKDYTLSALSVYSVRLNTLLEFLQTYDTIAKIKEKTQVWKLYNILKK